MLAGAAELGDEVMEGGSGGSGCGVAVGASEAVEGVDVEMGFQEFDGMLGEEGVAIVGEGVWVVFREIGDLVVGDDDFGWRNSCEFVEELGGVGEFGDDEFAGGVVDGGEAVGILYFREGGEVVGALVVEQGEVVDGAGGEDAGDFAFDEFSRDGL